MNSINLIGRLTRDVEMRYTQNQTAVANFGLAVRRAFAKEGYQDVDFINCTAFGKTAELIEKHVSKGNQLGVSGRLAIEQYEKDGQQRNATKVMVDSITFVGNSQGSQSQQENPGFEPVNEEDLPF